MDPLKEFLFLAELRDLSGFALHGLERMREIADRWMREHAAARELARKNYPSLAALRQRSADRERLAEAIQAFGDAQSEFFQLLEGFLATFGRVSLILFPQGEKRSPDKHDRALLLREALGIADDHPIGERTLRNKWMHFDEVLDSLPITAHFIAQRFVDSAEVSERERATVLRLFVVDQLRVEYLGIGSFTLPELKQALEDIRSRALMALTSWPIRRGLVAPEEEHNGEQ